MYRDGRMTVTYENAVVSGRLYVYRHGKGSFLGHSTNKLHVKKLFTVCPALYIMIMSINKALWDSLSSYSDESLTSVKNRNPS